MKKEKIMALVFSVAFIGACGEKSELDLRLNELCRQDGGSNIFETINLPSQMFDENNNVKQTSIRKNDENLTLIADLYIETFRSTVLKAGDPLKGEGTLLRQNKQIRRISDGKILAESVQYVRAGGDGFHIGHHTTTMCPMADGGLIPKVFSKQ